MTTTWRRTSGSSRTRWTAGVATTLRATTSDPEGESVALAWDTDGDGAFDDAPVFTPEPGPLDGQRARNRRGRPRDRRHRAR